MEHPKMIYLRWWDSMGGSGDWTSVEEMTKEGISTIESVGWLVEERDDQWVICLSLCLAENAKPYNGLMYIPKVAVQDTGPVKMA